VHRNNSAKSHLVVAIVCALLLILGLTVLHPWAARSVGAAALTSPYVYVGSAVQYGGNSSSDGYITGFGVAADGSAQIISGSPFHGPSYHLTAIRNFVFADDGRNIGTYTRSGDGALSPTSIVNDLARVTEPIDQAIYALNPDRTGQSFNTVVSCGSCNSEILTWAIGQDGKLSYVADPTPSSSYAKWNGVFTFAPDDRFAYTEPWLSGLTEFQREANGTLRLLSDNGPPGIASAPAPPSQGDSICLPGNMAVSSKGYIVLSWWGSEYGCNDDGYLLGTYKENQDGTLQLLTQVGMVPQVYENAMAFDPSGTYVALAGTSACQDKYGCAALQIYKLQADGTLTPVGALQVVPGTSFANLAWDSAGHLYILTGKCGQGCDSASVQGLYIYNFDGQNLKPAPGSPHAINNPVSLAVAPES
jgi:hypothetical protein